MPLDQEKVRKPTNKLRKLLKQIDGTSTPDTVHKLRTNSRKLETILPVIPLGSPKLLKGLKAVRKRAGHVRDMDVLTADTATLRVHGDNECAVQLLEYLGSKRYREAQKLQREARRASKQLRRKLGKATAALARRHSDRSTSGPDSVGLMHAVLRETMELRQPRRLNRNNIHEYRLKVKQLRYLLQMADDQNRDERFIAALGKVKDAIGEWHDWEQLSQLAGKVLDHDNCELKQHIAGKADSELRRALRVSEELRLHFLNPTSAPTGGARSRRSGGGKLQERVLRSITSLAA